MSSNGAASYPTNLIDYGDAAYGSSTLQELDSGQYNSNYVWTTYDIYEASWGIGWDIPIPEIYYQGQANDWKIVTTAGGTQGVVQYYGVTTECSGHDTVQEPNCYVARANDCEFGPSQALAVLENTTGETSPPQTNETNIQWQNDGRSSTTC